MTRWWDKSWYAQNRLTPVIGLERLAISGEGSEDHVFFRKATQILCVDVEASSKGDGVESLRILLVEDFGEFRGFICSLLETRAEFQVKQAWDGLEAVQKAEERRSDLILLDISLPRLNGMEVARRVLKLAPDAKILFFSVESDADLVIEALRLGAGYIHKPRARRDLFPAIDAVLRGEQFVSSGLLPTLPSGTGGPD